LAKVGKVKAQVIGSTNEPAVGMTTKTVSSDGQAMSGSMVFSTGCGIIVNAK